MSNIDINSFAIAPKRIKPSEVTKSYIKLFKNDIAYPIVISEHIFNGKELYVKIEEYVSGCDEELKIGDECSLSMVDYLYNDSCKIIGERIVSLHRYVITGLRNLNNGLYFRIKLECCIEGDMRCL